MAEQSALEYLLADDIDGRDIDGIPDECCSCPFGTAQQEPYAPNPYDPGEGYYQCALLNLTSVWGESPKCSVKDWRARARHELRELLA